MKKRYQTPETLSIKIHTVHMIADSLGYGGTTSGNSITEMSSRDGSSLWDDDDDEDY